MTHTIQCLKLDLLLLKPYFKSIFLVLLVPLIFPVFTGSLFEGLSFAVTVLAMTTAYTFSVAEKNNLNRLYGFLPVRRKNLVAGRYLAIFLIGMLSILFELAAQVLILTLMKSVIPQSSEILSIFLICLLLFCIYAGVQIPGYYRYGSIKGKILMFLPTVGFLLFYFIVKSFGKNAASTNLDFLQNTTILIGGAIVLMVLIVGISASVSAKIVARNR